MPENPKKIDMVKTLRDYIGGFKTIWSRLKGIEWLTATLLYIAWVFSLSFWLRVIFSRIIRWSLIVEIYVITSVAITVAVWWWVPTFWWAAFCSYFLASTAVTLFHVMLLTTVFGPIESAERSLILIIFNVVQLLFTFAIWYEWQAGLGRGKSLLNAILVFGTVGYLNEPTTVVGAQIVADFVLLAIFLAFLVGKIGQAQDR